MATILYVCILSMALKLSAAEVNSETTAAQDVLATILDETEYDKRVRPRGVNTTTKVLITFNLLTVNDLNSVSETLETTAYLEMQWDDDRLEWENDDISEDFISVPQDEVWKPDVSLKNSISDVRTLGNKYQYVTVYSDNSVVWFPFQVFESNCDLDIQHFPFDVQTCSLEFTAWSYIAQQVAFENAEIDLGSYQTSNLFDLVSTSTEVDVQDGSSVAIFTLELKRKPLFVFLTSVVPIITLAVMANCVFLLPFDSGEKIGYVVTVFLAFMVALTYITTILPENSDTISYLAMYVTSQVVQSTVQTFITVILCMLYYRDENEKPIPKCLMLMGYLCCLYEKKPRRKNRRWKSRRNPPRTTYNEYPRDSYDDNNSSMPMRFYPESRERSRREVESSPYYISGKRSYDRHNSGDHTDEEVVYGRQSDHDEDTSEAPKVTWKQVVNRLDVFFFVFFLIVFIICTTLYVVACIRRL